MANKDQKLNLFFKNGFEVSIIDNDMSYGLEMAVFNKDGEFHRTKKSPDGIYGYNTADELVKLLNKIRKWDESK